MTASQAAQVLVIDDDEVILTVISELLENAGYRVLTQTSPVGAADRVIRHNVDAAIVDLNMPIMRGDNVIRLFRSRARSRDLPVILISGQDPQKLKKAGEQLAGVGVVTKSNMSADLVNMLATLLSGRQHQERQWGTIIEADGLPDGSSNGKFGDWMAFFEQLSTAMKDTRTVWGDIKQGNMARASTSALSPKLEALERRAGELRLSQAAQVIRGLREVLTSVPSGVVVQMATDGSVEKAIIALLGLRTGGGADLAASTRSVVEGLERAKSALKGA